MLVGVIADTHGYLDPRVAQAFAGVGVIIHAGDVGSEDVLDQLARLAPVHAVYGNNDEKFGGFGLRLHEDFNISRVRVHLVHQLPHAKPEWNTRLVVTGHSHKPSIDPRDGMLYVNPGAAGRAGFHGTQTVAVLRILSRAIVEARIVELGPRLPIAKRAARTVLR
jgi:putative phosphoesterase